MEALPSLFFRSSSQRRRVYEPLRIRAVESLRNHKLQSYPRFPQTDSHILFFHIRLIMKSPPWSSISEVCQIHSSLTKGGSLEPHTPCRALCCLQHTAVGSRCRSCQCVFAQSHSAPGLHLFSFSSMSEVLASLLGMVGAT